MMVTRFTRIAALPAVAAMLAAAVACAPPASSPAPAPGESSAVSTPAGTPVREQGYVINCTGVRGDGSRVLVDLYTNLSLIHI